MAKHGIATSLQKLAYFQTSPSIPTAISSDASPHGLGAMLWQQDGRGQWTPVAGASRSLTETESRYSQLEREMLGVVFAITRFRQYVLGRPIQAFTDHKPLISIIRKPFDEVPPRLQRWLVALMPYQFSLIYKPGRHLVCADALSRAPLAEQHPTPEESRGMGEYVSLVLEEAPVGLCEIQRASQDDPLINSVMKRVITNVWREPSPAEEPYYLLRDQLTSVDGTLLLGNRYVIPEGLRRPVLRLAHEGHPGKDAFLDTLRRRVWWPSLTRDAGLFAERCDVCWRKRPNCHQDLQPSELEGVWEKLAVDLVTIDGYTCLSIIDYGSRYPEVLPLSSTTSTGVIEKLMEVFARFGIPSTLVSDNGPQFIAAEMVHFLQQLNIRHIRASPRYPQSNGMVERLHRILRERLRGLRPSLPFPRRLQQTLMDIRNSTNRMLGTTPSEALFGRILHTRLPCYRTPIIVNPAHQFQAKARMASDHDSKRGVQPLPSLRPGTIVTLQDGYTDPTKQWRVIEQYRQQVGVSDGRRIMLRNRRHTRPYYCNGDNKSSNQLDGVTIRTPQEQKQEPLHEESRDTQPTTSEATLSLPQEPYADKSETLVESSRPHASPKEPFYKEGVTTRSGRQVKLSDKAREADL